MQTQHCRKMFLYYLFLKSSPNNLFDLLTQILFFLSIILFIFMIPLAILFVVLYGEGKTQKRKHKRLGNKPVKLEKKVMDEMNQWSVLILDQRFVDIFIELFLNLIECNFTNQ